MLGTGAKSFATSSPSSQSMLSWYIALRPHEVSDMDLKSGMHSTKVLSTARRGFEADSECACRCDSPASIVAGTLRRGAAGQWVYNSTASASTASLNRSNTSWQFFGALHRSDTATKTFEHARVSLTMSMIVAMSSCQLLSYKSSVIFEEVLTVSWE